ncbi:MAG: 30S ribosomal protein S20 [Myxococcales bacterium]|nr:30S ribosomal protein S20 [Myxococcales bacterium]MCB9733061.1 30S ribosomal protein S20 [Deltaproteobacteria bacterium]
MANHAQALKRHRQSEKRRAANNFFKATMRTSLKKARAALATKDASAAAPLVRDTCAYVDHIAGKGVIPKARASRLKSRLMGQLAALG